MNMSEIWQIIRFNKMNKITFREQKLYVMRDSAGNLTVVLRCNTANSSLTIDVKNENMIKRIGSVLYGK